ncbi:hypothetical protein DLAC_01810 [Tieghemostelium lacteum]|uniref:Peptidase M16 family protein n=1 Tax=Tieghemostelium lacteum TaxID=361077 RepID=A0A152A6C9_TIELA|nr:hypothetical protein DLAC_01810 [Tieghemostelium lacteum]|eukprot:KYR01796.1 hypothetical protein DLAC_01810 [Tieghemostelium lacteum]
MNKDDSPCDNNNNNSKYQSTKFKFIEEFSIPIPHVKDRIQRFRHNDCDINLILHFSDGPKCNVNIIVPTENSNNKGLAHTLEHLVFEGCNDIPYRQFIEVLSNRCFSAPSNAYTSEDHTCYSIESVGPDGIVNYLPLYMKFILTPTLKQSDFVTEIYHIDQDGQEQGVLFSEMKARENTLEELQELTLNRLLYPNTGYAYSVGGLTNEIPQIENQMIREYHAKFYQPQLITIVVQGCINSDKLFRALDDMNFPKSPFYKHISDIEFLPWQTNIEPLSECKSEIVSFPCETETTGNVVIGWRGPTIKNIFKIYALEALFRYFHGNNSSPFNQRFINKSIPLASNVSWSIQELKETKVLVEFSGVPLNFHSQIQEYQSANEKQKDGNGNEMEIQENNEEQDEDNEDEEDDEELGDEDEDLDHSGDESESDIEDSDQEEEDNIKDEMDENNNLLQPGSLYKRVVKLLRSFREKGFPDGSGVMKKIIEKEKIKLFESFEDDPHGSVFGNLLAEVCFPPGKGKDFEIRERFNSFEILQQLSMKEDEFWFDLIDEFFLNDQRPYVEVIMVPNIQLANDISMKNKLMVENRCNELGVEGLKEKGKLVKEAIENNKPFPDEYRSLLPAIPSIDNIPLLQIESQILFPETTENPRAYAIQMVQVNSQFIHLSMHFYIQDLPSDLRSYLTLFQATLYDVDLVIPPNFSTSKEKEPTSINYKQVSSLIAEETCYLDGHVGLSNSTFSCGSSEMFRVAGGSQPDRFDKLLYWMLNGLFNFHLTTKRLINLVTHLLSSLSEVSRDSASICGNYAVFNLFPDLKSSNEASISIFNQRSFLKQLLITLKDNDHPDQIELIKNNLYRIRDLIVQNPTKMFIQLSHSSEYSGGDLINQFSKAWDKYLSEASSIKQTPQKRKLKNSSLEEESRNSPIKVKFNGDSNNVIPYFQPLQRYPSRLPSGIKSEQIVLKGSESNNLLQYVPMSIGILHQDYPPVALLCDIFNAKEGDIRSKGYAYGFNLTLDTAKKILIFGLNDAVSPILALNEFYQWLKTIESNHQEILTLFELETAVSQEVFDFFSSKSTPSELIFNSLIYILRGMSTFQEDIQLMNRYSTVKIQDLLYCFEKYFKQFLLTDNLYLIISTNQNSQDIIKSQLKSMNNISIETKDVNSLFIK